MVGDVLMTIETRVFLLTNLITVTFLVILGTLNMVVRMGLPFSLNVVIGPVIAGLLVGTAISFVVKHYLCKINNIEQEKKNVLVDTQRELIYKMGEIGESRSKETGVHVKMVAEYSKLLAQLIGLDENSSELLKNASPMHDIGKVAIPDSILLKPGKLSPAEFDIMKTHTTIGYEILKQSKREILQSAAIVSHHHHEHWDGTGYPQNLKGTNIHIFGRITSVVDVFDALSVDRVYKKAWTIDRIMEFMKENRGSKFDPDLLDIFIVNLDQFLAIRNKYKEYLSDSSAI